MKYYVGCIGWKNQTWEKNFYPDGLEPSHYLSYYSNIFNFVHLDLGKSNTLPSSSTFNKWSSDTPDNFRFSVRVPQDIINKSANLSTSGYDIPSTSQEHYDILGKFLDKLHPIREKILVIVLSPPSHISLQNIGRKWLENTLTICKYHGFSTAIDFDKQSSWYQDLTYNLLKRYESSFVWSNTTNQYYYPAITTNFVFLNLGNSYINRQTATKYLDLLRRKATDGNKQFQSYSLDVLDCSIIVAKSPPIAQLIQKLALTEKNPSGNVKIVRQELPVSSIWPGRVIMHIDMNAFFPACEELRDASLKGKAHAVIMTPEKEGGLITRGAVASCSYEARKYGVRSAMSLSRAKELCPDLLLKPVDKEYYSSVSHQVMRLLEEYADVLEQTSIDEAFVDCTKKLMLYRQRKFLHNRFDEFDDTLSCKNIGKIDVSSITVIPSLSKPEHANSHSHKLESSPQQPVSEDTSHPVTESITKSDVEEYALKIKSSILEQCNGLICSIGVANNKSIAKIASDFQKPDGLTIVHPQNIMPFLSKLAVDQISGIGIKTTKTLKAMGINTIGELSKTDVQKLLEKFGKKHGLWMWQIANGRESEPVIPRGDNLSISSEETLLEPINDRDEILKIFLHSLTDDIYKRIAIKGYEFRTVGIKLVQTNFSIETREFTFSAYQRTKDSISSVIEMLLDRFGFENYFDPINNTPTARRIYPSYIRKLGIKVSNLSRIEVTTREAQKSILDFV
ncbi:DUF72 domain-containing protein [Candidatus Nitrosocosmicus sp. FF01]|uniref:Y-family DNA polymerase n=1 Tax=Candidatus Nitrosocosmicus sp. FF01 TaxID=3397670 RepID=UPI0039E83ADB